MQGMRCLEKPRDWQYREKHSQKPHVLSYLHAFSPSEIENSGFYAESPISSLPLPQNDTPAFLPRQARARVTPFRRAPRPGPTGTFSVKVEPTPGGVPFLSRGCERVLWGRKSPVKMQEPHPAKGV